ncbi:putative facilitator of salicylate uptake, partial [hydrothermal vent metagenome]
MKNILKRTLTSAAVTALLVSPLAHATNGYFKIGAGTKNRGLAGAGIAFGQDGIAAAVNPASIAFVDDQVNIGVEIFMPKRKSQLDATGMGGANSNVRSRANKFALPSLGLVKAWNNKISLGLSAVGNGGMNTRYGDANTGGGNIYSEAFGAAIPGFVVDLITAGAEAGNTAANAALLGGNPNNTPSLGINLAQLLLSPTIAYKITPNQSIGFGPVIGYQTFRAYGLGLFQGLSSDPGKVTNNGNDSALGVGAQIGYQGNFGMFSVGLMGRTKIYMEE